MFAKNLSNDELDLEIAKIREDKPAVLPDWEVSLHNTINGTPFYSPNKAWVCLSLWDNQDEPAWYPAPVSHDWYATLTLLQEMRSIAPVELVFQKELVEVRWQGVTATLSQPNGETRAVAECFYFGQKLPK